ncbi:hypothetical protein MmTuc01_3140 [Methanosarcina mazei Tuc01]|uniref:Uncharacterized protein n=1 Tax=Methanosarcina mazei Tuc01 TaxID=1236903 RepID=M1PCY8_METMZ|nr:hypothetical protein MmTuc01_3140 [Methanosarcina mazei Tuc01]
MRARSRQSVKKVVSLLEPIPYICWKVVGRHVFQTCSPRS